MHLVIQSQGHAYPFLSATLGNRGTRHLPIEVSGQEGKLNK